MKTSWPWTPPLVPGRDWLRYWSERSEPLADFAAEFAGALFGDWLYQKVPNLRIQPPGGSILDWHTDEEFGHAPTEWNVWVPLTDLTHVSQCLWVDDGEPHPVTLRRGEPFAFPGGSMRHCSKANETNVTRYSFDFRIVAREDYERHYAGTERFTVRYGVPMKLGTYWAEP